MLDINKDRITLLKVALKGSEKALQTAYRQSIVMLAQTDLDFGPDSQPEDLEFRWEWIDAWRVLTVLTDGSGFVHDFSGIPGLTDCVWVMYDWGTGEANSNDVDGIMLNDRDKFHIPRDVRFDVDANWVSDVSGVIGFSFDSPDGMIKW